MRNMGVDIARLDHALFYGPAGRWHIRRCQRSERPRQQALGAGALCGLGIQDQAGVSLMSS